MYWVLDANRISPAVIALEYVRTVERSATRKRPVNCAFGFCKTPEPHAAGRVPTDGYVMFGLTESLLQLIFPT